MPMHRLKLRSTVSSFSFAVAAALVVSGCSNSGEFPRLAAMQRVQPAQPQPSATQTPSPALQMVRPADSDHEAGAAYWGAQYQTNRDDIEAGINFARNLRLIGGAEQAVVVMKDMVMRFPNNMMILAEYGKALTAANRPGDALAFLTQAIQLSPNDWTLWSARGVANDQSGDHKSARTDYEQALELNPGNSTVMTNLALSHLLAGNPSAAEPVLREVAARPDATPAMRQNLAMVLTLQGRTAEAESIGRRDLGPVDAKDNVQLFSQFDMSKAIPSDIAKTPQASAIVSPEIATPTTPALASAATDATRAPTKIQAVASADPIAPAQAETATVQAPAVDEPAANSFKMTPVADDQLELAVSASSPAPKPARATPVKKPSTSAAAKPAKPVTVTDGERLITTINGIPVIGDDKPLSSPAAQPSAILRRSSAGQL